MMDNLEDAIIRLFRRISVWDVISGKVRVDNISQESFVQLMRSYSDRYSDTELRNLYRYLVCNFVDLYHGVEYRQAEDERLDLFVLLRYYSTWILTIQDDEVVCEYLKMLHWRMVTSELSEDLFVSSFLAWHNRRTAKESVYLDWRTAITHNNRELRRILSRGIAENHSHLKGAPPVFELTWVNLMNDLSLHMNSEELQKIEQSRRNVNVKYDVTWKEDELSFQLLQAACIRVILFKVVNNDLYTEKELLKGLLEGLLDKHELEKMKGVLSDFIYLLKKPLYYEELPDYALGGALSQGAKSDSLTFIFQGERWLMYTLFSKIFGEDSRIIPYKNLFYAYLLIKENFRSEIVQNNRSVGFENFSIYEQRKDVFLENTFWSRMQARMAILVSLIENHAVISEARIVPAKSARDNLNLIEKLDTMIDPQRQYRHRYFYVMHFIKSEEKSLVSFFTKCRHWVKRDEYKKQALELAAFREQYPYCADRIRGIDAANMEIGCGPENFAQAFRFLAGHTVTLEKDSRPYVPQLRITYHVGEDYLDLVSGLRAIDEAVHFLGMRCGDRLGHALALGVNAKKWYYAKNNRILISQQEYLDNIAWMYHLLVASQIPNQEKIKSFLKKEFEYYFQMIYRNAMNQEVLNFISEKAAVYYKGTEWKKYYEQRTYDFNIENYCSAWKLRGDDPELYREGFFANRQVLESDKPYWGYYAINQSFPHRQNKRYFQEIGLLYYYYHYDCDVRREGSKPVEKKISNEFIQCVEDLQYELQKQIVKCGISIETNPSSNYLIGTFKSYIEHPIVRFYNRELVESEEELVACPQMNVSINTDDAGIFATSLENEYAYMALALEKAKDANGNLLYKKKNVYSWIDSVRRMGLEQVFLSDMEMGRAIAEWREQENRDINHAIS